MRHLRLAVPLTAFAFLATACADADVDAGDEDLIEEPVVEAPAAVEPMGDMPMDMTVTLEPVNDSGISGDAVATHAADSVTVVVNVSGLQAGTEYPAHVHQGTCETGGGVAAPLQAITAAEGGAGTSTTTIPASQLPADADAFIQVHGPDGQPVACGNVPGHG